MYKGKILDKDDSKVSTILAGLPTPANAWKASAAPTSRPRPPAMRCSVLQSYTPGTYVRRIATCRLTTTTGVGVRRGGVGLPGGLHAGPKGQARCAGCTGGHARRRGPLRNARHAGGAASGERNKTFAACGGCAVAFVTFVVRARLRNSRALVLHAPATGQQAFNSSTH